MRSGGAGAPSDAGWPPLQRSSAGMACSSRYVCVSPFTRTPCEHTKLHASGGRVGLRVGECQPRPALPKVRVHGS
ncbi:hypothetical protein OAO87_01715 [bacterium]|nr:hypothetical protein [bacterium]